MGGLELQLGGFEIGKRYVKWFKLHDLENMDPRHESDMGEIELSIEWIANADQQMVEKERLRLRNAIKIQSWARMMRDFNKRKHLNANRMHEIATVRAYVVSIQCFRRCLVARRLRRDKVEFRKKLKLLWARRYLHWWKLVSQEYVVALVVQCAARRRRARVTVFRHKLLQRVQRHYGAILFQKLFRGYVGKLRAREREQAVLDQEIRESSAAASRGEIVQVSGSVAIFGSHRWSEEQRAWRATYGKDPEFGSKRTGRILLRAFRRILESQASGRWQATQGVVTRFGRAYVIELRITNADDATRAGAGKDAGADGGDGATKELAPLVMTDKQLEEDFKKVTDLKKLKAQCKKFGLSVNGKRSELVKRLDEFRNAQRKAKLAQEEAAAKRAAEAAKRAAAKVAQAQLLLENPPDDATLSRQFRASLETIVVEIRGCIVSMPAKEREAVVAAAARHRAFLHPATVSITGTVGLYATTIQCMVRQRQAARAALGRLYAFQAAVKLQALFRRRQRRVLKAALLFQSAIRRFKARKLLAHKQKEIIVAIDMQCAFRAMMARRAFKIAMRFPDVDAITSSSQLGDLFGPYNTTDGSEHSFWCSRMGKTTDQFIVYDLKQLVGIDAVELLAPTNSSAPRRCKIHCAESTVPGNDDFVASEFTVLPRPVWQVFPLDPYRPGHLAFARFWKLTMMDNHGSTEHVAVRGVRFIRKKEVMVHVLPGLQPTDIYLPEAPGVKKKGATVKLFCGIAGWPPPHIEWIKDGKVIPGETGETLTLSLEFPDRGRRREFKCKGCARGTRTLNDLVVYVKCLHCGRVEDLGRFSRDDHELAKFGERLKLLQTQLAFLESQKAARQQTSEMEDEGGEGAEVANIAGCTSDAPADLDDAEALRRTARARRLEQRIKHVKAQLAKVVPARYLAECEYDASKPRYSCEGVYQCIARQVRAGVEFVVKSKAAVVHVGPAPPLGIRVTDLPVVPEPKKRVLWTKYRSIHGCFVHGILRGNVIVRYSNLDTYVGPYVDEDQLDNLGQVAAEALVRGHVGTWKAHDGKVYEGTIVTNHFDVAAFNGYLKLTLPSGEVYEGEHIRGQRHGVGRCTYADGASYEGFWFRGKRRGFGCYTDVNGQQYEGEWDDDEKKGVGMWNWSDRSSYIGPQRGNMRTGYGTYMSAEADVYVGEFKDSRMKGRGHILYNNRGSYTGNFNDNLREGEGTSHVSDTVRHIGVFEKDQRHGIVKELRTIKMHGGQKADEEQEGLWEHGKFREWLGPPNNPEATRAFIARFQKRSDFRSPFATMVGQSLPNLPGGVLFTNPDVQAIIKQILRRMDPEEVGTKSRSQAVENLEAVNSELELSRQKHDVINGRWSKMRAEIKHIEDEAEKAENKLAELQLKALDKEKEIDAFWANEPTASTNRDEFDTAVAELSKLPPNLWVKLRNSLNRPQQPVIGNTLLSLCVLLGVEPELAEYKKLVSSSKQNKQEGGEKIVHEYDIKATWMLASLDMYSFCRRHEATIMLDTQLTSPEIDPANPFLIYHGKVLVNMARVVRAALPYAKTCYKIEQTVGEHAGIKVEIARLNLVLNASVRDMEKRRAEADALRRQLEPVRWDKEKMERKARSLALVVEQCDALLEQGEESSSDEEEWDAYRRIEEQVKPRRKEGRPEAPGSEGGELEVLMEVMLRRVVRRFKGDSARHTVQQVPDIIEQLKADTKTRFDELTRRYEAGEASFAFEEASEREVVAASVVGTINRSLGNTPEVQTWYMADGRPQADLPPSSVHRESIETLVTAEWKLLEREKALQGMFDEWSVVFPDDPPMRAVEARFNWYMTDENKIKAQKYEEHHRWEIVDAEQRAADTFCERHKDYSKVKDAFDADGVIDNAAEAAFAVLYLEGEGSDNFTTVMEASMYAKLCPAAMAAYKSKRDDQLSINFEKAHVGGLDAGPHLVQSGPGLAATAAAAAAAVGKDAASRSQRTAAGVDVGTGTSPTEEEARLAAVAEAACAIVQFEDDPQFESAKAWAERHLSLMAAAEEKASGDLASAFAKRFGDATAEKAVKACRLPGAAPKWLEVQALAWRAKHPHEYEVIRKDVQSQETQQARRRRTEIRKLSEKHERVTGERQLATARALIEKLTAHQEIMYEAQIVLEHARSHLEARTFEIIVNERPSEKEDRLVAWNNEQIKTKRSLEARLHEVVEEISKISTTMEKYAEPGEEEVAETEDEAWQATGVAAESEGIIVNMQTPQADHNPPKVPDNIGKDPGVMAVAMGDTGVEFK